MIRIWRFLVGGLGGFMLLFVLKWGDKGGNYLPY